jgi:ribonuclease BN (tRNA processing enzyme)
MKITFIGTASGFTELERAHASVLLESAGVKTLIDCGEGATVSLLKRNIPLNNIDRIIVSHTHPDHCSGIPTAIQYMHLAKRETPLTIYLPEGVTHAFEVYFRQLYLINGKLNFQYQLESYSEGEVLAEGGLIISATGNLHLDHYRPFAEKYGFTLGSYSLTMDAEGKKVFYSGDVKGKEDFNPPSEADLLIVESMHIPCDEIMKIASQKGIGKVIFTHIPPNMDTGSLTHCNLTGIFAFDGLEIYL